LPALQARRAQIGQRGLIEIRTPGGALPAGFAIGHTFQEVGQYQLAVEQDSGPLWRSDAPPEKTHQPDWASYILPGNPAKPDAAVVILAIPDRTIEAVAGAVGTYFDEGETFQTFFQQTTYDYGALEEALTTGFTVEALRSLIAGSAALAPLLGQAATDAGSAALAAHLVQYARQQMLEAELVALIRQGNPRRYARVTGRLFKQPGQSDHLKGALFLVAGAIEAEDRFIADWEAAALARTSRAHLIDFVAQVRPQTVHLFLAAPFALAAFLGHRWNAINTVLQCYDFVGGEKSYAPACRLII
jgi:hypothetical protein